MTIPKTFTSDLYPTNSNTCNKRRVRRDNHNEIPSNARECERVDFTSVISIGLHVRDWPTPNSVLIAVLLCFIPNPRIMHTYLKVGTAITGRGAMPHQRVGGPVTALLQPRISILLQTVLNRNSPPTSK